MSINYCLVTIISRPFCQITYLCVLKMKKLIYVITFLILIPLMALARQTPQDLAYQREIEIAAGLMELGAFDSADFHLRHVIQNMKVLPTKISFYFGKNSLSLKRYKQSINWLNKYMELAGTTGQFFDESVKLLEKAEEEYRLERNQEIEFMVSELHGEKGVKCEGTETIICPVCKGLGVVIKEKNFGKEYWPCPFSDARGLLSCSDYNLLIEGKLKPRN